MPFSFHMSVCIMGLLFVTARIPVVIFDYYHDLLERRLLRSTRRRISNERVSYAVLFSSSQRRFRGIEGIIYYIISFYPAVYVPLFDRGVEISESQ